MIALDTNILARAFAEDDAQQTPVAQRLLTSLSGASPGFISLTVMVELYWVLTKSIRLPAARVEELFDALIATTEIEIEDGESVGEALERARHGADFADALIHATSRLYGVADTVTFDREAAGRFGWRLLS